MQLRRFYGSFRTKTLQCCVKSITTKAVAMETLNVLAPIAPHITGIKEYFVAQI